MELADLIDRGVAARALLEDAAFLSVVDELFATWERETFMTAPDNQERRDALYHQHLALQSILALLRSRVIQGELALEQVELDRQEHEDEEND